MARLFALTLAVVLSMLLAVAADPRSWGEPGNGLRLSVSLAADESGNDPVLEIAIQNVGKTDVLLPLGGVFDYWGCGSDRMKIVLNRPDGTSGLVTCSVMSHLGEMGSLVVPLPPGASYRLRNPIARYLVASEPLSSAIHRSLQLRVELNTSTSDCRVYQSGPRCWHGTLVSNVLQLPN
jgi:hypothetical protein